MGRLQSFAIWAGGMLLLSSTLTGVVPACVHDLEINFYRQDLLNETLSLHSIPQSNWNLIYYELSKRVQSIPMMLDKYARQMKPNPFDEPYQPKAAEELLERVLLQVLNDTLVVFHIQNAVMAEEMFYYIRNKQNHKFVDCFGEKK